MLMTSTGNSSEKKFGLETEDVEDLKTAYSEAS
jgi:hypothetical protein